HFNLAESYYMATWNLSSTYEIVGDPKTSIVLDTLNGIPPITGTEIEIHPNPSSGIFIVSFPAKQNSDASVYDVLGNVLWKERWSVSSKTHSINLNSQPAGIYFLKVKQGSNESVIKLVKE